MREGTLSCLLFFPLECPSWEAGAQEICVESMCEYKCMYKVQKDKFQTDNCAYLLEGDWD